LGGLACQTKSKAETARWLDRLVNNDSYRERIGHLGLRKVLSEHTYKERMNFILQQMGMDKFVQQSNPMISVVCSTNRPHRIGNVLDNYQRQSYENKELLVILNEDSMSVEGVKKLIADRGIDNARVFQLPSERSLGECLNLAIDKSEGEFWTKIDDDNYYAENFLSDLMLAFDYTDAAIVGKCAYYCYLSGSKTLAIRFFGEENKYVNFLSGSAMICKREVFDKVRFPEQSISEDTIFLKDCIKNNFKLYSADKYNYVCMRNPNLDEHTWKIDEDEYLRKCKVISYTDDYKTPVTI
ncbi:MAG: glycosyltransferase, partial [Myxococcota bacterium]|jgi:glycosyltransferase involved in cell wall biosynthesis|nr:glycosyltransferase [Myxococcota bacterium]